MEAILPYAATSWSDAAAAAAALLLAFLLAWIANRLLHAAELRLAAREGRVTLDPAGKTRLRLVRRLIFAVILGAGLFFALLQFDSFDKLAGAALASSAVIAAVAGLAARQSLGNLIAGVTLALTQPIRVGDMVEIGDVRGRVEDLTLTFTWLRTPDGRRVALPNELLMTLPLRNETLAEDAIVPSADVWIGAGDDADRALAALRALEGVREVGVDEVAPEGVRLRVALAPGPAGARLAAESRLREQALAALRGAGVAPPNAA
jgi:small-conductance mechanosensitive channel